MLNQLRTIRGSSLDQILLFSFVLGPLILFYLLTDYSGGLRTIATIAFLSFYPGYLFVRRIPISSLVFKVILSVGVSLSLIVVIALVALTSGHWDPTLHIWLIVSVVLLHGLITFST